MNVRTTSRPGPLTFDPVTLGRAECDAWASYYRRAWVPFLRAALDLTFFPELYAVRAEIGR